MKYYEHCYYEDPTMEFCIRISTSTPVGPQGPQGGAYNCIYCTRGQELRTKVGLCTKHVVTLMREDGSIQPGLGCNCRKDNI